MDDPATTRATRCVRADPLSAPDEPMRLLTRPWDAAPGDRSRDVQLIIQRELCTVGEARVALAAARAKKAAAAGGAAAAPPAPLRLVVAGMELLDDDALVWDAGVHTNGPVMYVIA